MDNKIRLHLSKSDLNGEHREYVVHEEDGKFIFDCYEWGPGNANLNAAIRKQHLEFDTADEAIKEYQHYIATWENEIVD